MIVNHGILRIIHCEFAMMHFMIGDRITQKFHVVRTVIQHGQRGVNVEKEKDDHGVGLDQSHGRQDRGPRAEHANHVFNGMFIAGIEIATGGKVLSMMMLVNQGVNGGHVQYVMAGSIAHVQDEKHNGQCSKGVEEGNVMDVLGYFGRVPKVVTQPLHKDPLVHGVDAEIDEGLLIQLHISDGLAGRSGRKQLIVKDRVHQKDHQVVVKGNGGSNTDAADYPFM